MRAILHLSDWNMQDKYYEAPINLIRQFGLGIKANGISDAWKQFKENIDWDDDGSKPVKCNAVNMNLDLHFMDWDDHKNCLEDWDETGIFEEDYLPNGYEEE